MPKERKCPGYRGIIKQRQTELMVNRISFRHSEGFTFSCTPVYLFPLLANAGLALGKQRRALDVIAEFAAKILRGNGHDV
jgi:hypothetical protein